MLLLENSEGTEYIREDRWSGGLSGPCSAFEDAAYALAVFSFDMQVYRKPAVKGHQKLWHCSMALLGQITLVN